MRMWFSGPVSWTVQVYCETVGTVLDWESVGFPSCDRTLT